MAKKINGDPVSEYLAEIGRRGGQASVDKGFSMLSVDERKANAKRAAEARWGKKKPVAKKKAAKAKKK